MPKQRNQWNNLYKGEKEEEDEKEIDYGSRRLAEMWKMVLCIRNEGNMDNRSDEGVFDGIM